MAWVRPKHPKPKRKDPVEEADALRPLLQFFSAGHTPRQASRSRLLHNIAPPPPHEHFHEEAPEGEDHGVTEYSPQETVNNHAFSFSRDRLVPIAPKQSKARKPAPVERARQPQQHIVQQPIVQYPRDVSPPPPARPKPRAPTKSRPPPQPRQHFTADAPRSVSSRWISATTPLQL